MNILLTGATGFIGSRIINLLEFSKLTVLGRSLPEGFMGAFYEAEIGPDVDYSASLRDIDVVIHSAARAHVMDDKAESPLSAYRDVNVDGTLTLAKQAAAAGVKRFIFISSIKVNGESTLFDSAYKYDDSSSPEDAYGVSKMEAETGLLKLSKSTGMEVVIIRPPLVYGPGVKANFALMMNLARKNLPLPLGAIKNKRSLVGIDNLVDLIITCIDHPNAANQTFLVSDDNDVSTTDLLKELTLAAGKKPRLIPIPMPIIKFFATLLGKKSISDRLCGSLQVDITHTKETLGWVPPVSFQEGIARCFTKDK